MGFKMKGPSMYPNYRGSKAGTSDNGAAYGPDMGLALNKESKRKESDMRATSSPFQKNTGDKTKEQLIKEGFTPRDADMMIKDGATTGRQDKKPVPPKKTTLKVKKGSAADKKSKKPSQGDFVPAYPGADYSKEQIAKMTEKEKMMKIDGYEPKKKTTKKK